MKCPFKLNVPVELRTEDGCDPGCAWLMRPYENNVQACAIAVIAASKTELMGFKPENYVRGDAS